MDSITNPEKLTCSACGYENPAANRFCEKCGEGLHEQRAAQRLLDTDPELKVLNEKYAKLGIKRWISGASAAGSLFIFYQWLENDWFEFLSTPAMLAFPVAVVMFVIYAARRRAMGKKIAKILEEKMGEGVV